MSSPKPAKGFPQYLVYRSGVIERNGKPIRKFVNQYGYLCVSLYYLKSKKTRTVKLHLIMWDTFSKKKRNPKKQIDHKDGNKLNCSFDNLQEINQSKNITKGYEAGTRIKTPVKIKVDEFVVLTMHTLKPFRTVKDLVSYSELKIRQVEQIVGGKSRKDLFYPVKGLIKRTHFGDTDSDILKGKLHYIKSLAGYEFPYISLDEAERALHEYYETYPNLKEYQHRVQSTEGSFGGVFPFVQTCKEMQKYDSGAIGH